MLAGWLIRFSGSNVVVGRYFTHFTNLQVRADFLSSDDEEEEDLMKKTNDSRKGQNNSKGGQEKKKKKKALPIVRHEPLALPSNLPLGELQLHRKHQQPSAVPENAELEPVGVSSALDQV